MFHPPLLLYTPPPSLFLSPSPPLSIPFSPSSLPITLPFSHSFPLPFYIPSTPTFLLLPPLPSPLYFSPSLSGYPPSSAPSSPPFPSIFNLFFPTLFPPLFCFIYVAFPIEPLLVLYSLL